MIFRGSFGADREHGRRITGIGSAITIACGSGALLGTFSLVRREEVRAARTCWHSGAVMALAATVVGCGSVGANFPSPPRVAPVSSQVLLSSNGRVITAKGVIACGHRPILVARSYPGRVTLMWFNPDTDCHAEAIRAVWVRAVLPQPLGKRTLIQASTGKLISYRRT